MIHSSWEAADAYAEGAGGIGLYLPDRLFGDRQLSPDEEEQFTEYRQTLYAMRGRPITIALVDYSGFRRELLLLPGRHWGLLKTQIRAALRASVHGPVSVVLPGVETARGILVGRQLLAVCARELAAEGISCAPVPLGILVRSPSAIFHIARLAEAADFLVLDGRELLQSTTGKIGEADYPTMLWMLRRAADAGRRSGCRIVLTGELEQYPQGLQALMDTGIDEFALPVASLSSMRGYIEDLGA